MGGAGGHMPHPHDLTSVKDGEGLIQFFREAIDSIMEGNASLKIDGSNASFKLVDNARGGKEFVGDRGSLHPFDIKGITANNASDRFKPQKNEETGELTSHGMVKTYTELLNIFNHALYDEDVDIVPELKILGVYDNPTLIFNTEYVKGQTNVLGYDHDFLAIHNLGQIYEKHSNKGYRPGIPRPEVEDSETGETKAIGDFSTGVMLDKDQQKAMDSLLRKVGQVAKKHGFKIYGTVPAGVKEEASVDLERALSESFSINFDDDFNDVATYSLNDWLSTAKNPIHESVTLANGDQVSAMAKERIYEPIANGVSLESLLGPAPVGTNTSPNATRAIAGAVFWEAERVLGKEMLNALTSDMGDAENHEGVVLRDSKRFGVDAVKITGDFIIGGMASQHRKKEEEGFKCRKAGMIALVPGGYKPPHIEHLNMIRHYANVANKVFVFVSPLSRGSDNGDEHHVTKEMSENIWSLYLRAAGLSRKVKLLPSETNSPVKTALDWVTQPGNVRKGDCIVLGASTKPDERGVPDVKGRFDRGALEDYLEENHPNISEMITIMEPTDPQLIHEATVDMSGTDFRRVLAAKDYEKIRTFIPGEVDMNQVLAILEIPPEPEIELEPEELEPGSEIPEESGVLPENKKKGVFSSILYGLIEELLDEQTEPIQRAYAVKHEENRLTTKGERKKSAPFTVNPPEGRSESAPPLGEGEELEEAGNAAEFIAGKKPYEQACYEDPNCRELKKKKKKKIKINIESQLHYNALNNKEYIREMLYKKLINRCKDRTNMKFTKPQLNQLLKEELSSMDLGTLVMNPETMKRLILMGRNMHPWAKTVIDFGFGGADPEKNPDEAWLNFAETYNPIDIVDIGFIIKDIWEDPEAWTPDRKTPARIGRKIGQMGQYVGKKYSDAWNQPKYQAHHRSLKGKDVFTIPRKPGEKYRMGRTSLPFKDESGNITGYHDEDLLRSLPVTQSIDTRAQYKENMKLQNSHNKDLIKIIQEELGNLSIDELNILIEGESKNIIEEGKVRRGWQALKRGLGMGEDMADIIARVERLKTVFRRSGIDKFTGKFDDIAAILRHRKGLQSAIDAARSKADDFAENAALRRQHWRDLGTSIPADELAKIDELEDLATAQRRSVPEIETHLDEADDVIKELDIKVITDPTTGDIDTDWWPEGVLDDITIAADEAVSIERGIARGLSKEAKHRVIAHRKATRARKKSHKFTLGNRLSTILDNKRAKGMIKNPRVHAHHSKFNEAHTEWRKLEDQLEGVLEARRKGDKTIDNDVIDAMLEQAGDAGRHMDELEDHLLIALSKERWLWKEMGIKDGFWRNLPDTHPGIYRRTLKPGEKVPRLGLKTGLVLGGILGYTIADEPPPPSGDPVGLGPKYDPNKECPPPGSPGYDPSCYPGLHGFPHDVSSREGFRKAVEHDPAQTRALKTVKDAWHGVGDWFREKAGIDKPVEIEPYTPPESTQSTTTPTAPGAPAKPSAPPPKRSSKAKRPTPPKEVESKEMTDAEYRAALRAKRARAKSEREANDKRDDIKEISTMAGGAVSGPGNEDEEEKIIVRNEQLINDVINYLLKSGSR